MTNKANVATCVTALEENPREIYLETTKLLLKLANNILQNPSNLTYRRIRLSNVTIANKLIPVIGALECIFSMGFVEGEDSDSLVLPANSSLSSVKKIRDDINQNQASYMSGSSTTAKDNEVKVVPPVKVTEGLPSASRPSTSRNDILQRPRLQTPNQHSFLQRIENNFTSVLQYENKALQSRALNLIPLVELEIAAMKNLRKLQLEIKKGSKEQEMDINDLLLMELLNWFKNSFFKWVDSPECKQCQGPTNFYGLSTNPRELVDTNRVEVYECASCRTRTLFPRYNDPAKLLTTRRGRCGEWANCFTLFCRSLGWDARHVVDEDDHVWTEVYSGTQKRWLHCDPCENACDTPLMYEHGWGKKLSYVIAYSCDDIQDVTWRYSSNHPGIVSRRTQCSEEALLATILKARQSRQKNFSAARKAYLERRLLAELVEFLMEKHPTGTEYGGRSSGSLTWRLARGEIGDEVEVTQPFVWEPLEAELEKGEIRITYSSSQDEYQRVHLPSENSQKLISGWQNGVFEAKHVFRKVEKDWKKVYLARTDGRDDSTIKWKFDFQKQGVTVDRVRVTCHSDVFETGQVRWLLCNSDTCVAVKSGEPVVLEKEFCGASSLTLSAELKGGKGNSAWQHTQLFRQSVDDNGFPLDVSITFHK